MPVFIINLEMNGCILKIMDKQGSQNLLIEGCATMGYRNYSIAVYCRVKDILKINNLDEFRGQFDFITRNIAVNKVYLETFRGGRTIEKEKILKLKAFFNDRGIKTSGGITLVEEVIGVGFSGFCYTKEEGRKRVKEIVEFTASMFDEIILDDFYYTNCKCDECLRAKGNMDWAEYRLKLKREFSKELVAAVKKVNPRVNIIIKYPNWYEHYQDCGYNLEDESVIFDSIYTGTETRNPQYSQQHLPKYLSYFIMRYLENVKPGKNMGGWFDPFDCTYNLTSYADQAYLTLFGKARETSIFYLGALLDRDYSLCVPLLGKLYEDMDKVMGKLGNPAGTACYLPYHCKGENYLHNYLGMAGIPLEPYPYYPKDAKTIFLTEGAACDSSIIDKIEESLKSGADVIVTSGFLGKMQDKGFSRFTSARLTNSKACINRYAYSLNGVTFNGTAEAAQKVLLPQVEFSTNETWELAGAFGEENSFPILLKTTVSRGNLYILTIPDDFGDIYHYPREILKMIRSAFSKESPVMLDAKSKVTLYTYDNDTFALRSFLPYDESVNVIVKKPNARVMGLETGKVWDGITVNGETVFGTFLPPSVNRFYKIL